MGERARRPSAHKIARQRVLPYVVIKPFAWAVMSVEARLWPLRRIVGRLLRKVGLLPPLQKTPAAPVTVPPSQPPTAAAAAVLRAGGPVIALFSGTVEAARRYRRDHCAAELRMAGFDARIHECDTAGLRAASEQASLVILHRVPWSAEVERLCEAVRQRGGKCVYDTDDLIFQPDHVRWLHFSGQDAKRHADDHRALTTRYFATLDHCDAVFTTTQPLAGEIAAATGKAVYVIPNALSDEMVRLSNEAIQCWPAVDDGAVLIGYLSGTPTHDRDLAEAIPALVRLLQTNRQVILALVGFANDLLFPRRVRGRILNLHFQDWRKLPALTRRLDLVIAPLEAGSLFTACKSEVKYMEAGIVGVPAVATATAAFQTAITDGHNGWLVQPSDRDGWFEKLAIACDSRELRLAAGDAARQDCLKRYTAEARSVQIAEIVNRLLQAGDG